MNHRKYYLGAWWIVAICTFGVGAIHAQEPGLPLPPGSAAPLPASIGDTKNPVGAPAPTFKAPPVAPADSTTQPNSGKYPVPVLTPGNSVKPSVTVEQNKPNYAVLPPKKNSGAQSWQPYQNNNNNRNLPVGQKYYYQPSRQQTYQPSSKSWRPFDGTIARRISGWFSGKSNTRRQPVYQPAYQKHTGSPYRPASRKTWVSPNRNSYSTSHKAPTINTAPTGRRPSIFSGVTQPRSSMQALAQKIQSACGRDVRLTSLQPAKNGKIEVRLQAPNEKASTDAIQRIFQMPEMSQFNTEALEFHIDLPDVRTGQPK